MWKQTLKPETIFWPVCSVTIFHLSEMVPSLSPVSSTFITFMDSSEPLLMLWLKSVSVYVESTGPGALNQIKWVVCVHAQWTLWLIYVFLFVFYYYFILFWDNIGRYIRLRVNRHLLWSFHDCLSFKKYILITKELNTTTAHSFQCVSLLTHLLSIFLCFAALHTEG